MNNVSSKELSPIGKAMRDKGIQPGWLAKKLGVTVQTIRNYRYGERTPTPNVLYEIAQALGLQMEDLVEVNKAS